MRLSAGVKSISAMPSRSGPDLSTKIAGYYSYNSTNKPRLRSIRLIRRRTAQADTANRPHITLQILKMLLVGFIPRSGGR